MRDTEDFWRGAFGDAYTRRCVGSGLINNNTAFFIKALRVCLDKDINTIIEFGANRGLNIMSLRSIFRATLKTTAIEINEEALSELRKIKGLDVVEGSMLDFEPSQQYDLALVKGVLIHIAPEDLRRAYSVLYTSSRRYILIAEYYNSTPVEVPYRGHTGRLWKRDFASEIMDLYPDLKLIDYGFVWRRDPKAPQDDLTWFLMERGR